jgi:hypothetical protein
MLGGLNANHCSRPNFFREHAPTGEAYASCEQPEKALKAPKASKTHANLGATNDRVEWVSLEGQLYNGSQDHAAQPTPQPFRFWTFGWSSSTKRKYNSAISSLCSENTLLDHLQNEFDSLAYRRCLLNPKKDEKTIVLILDVLGEAKAEAKPVEFSWAEISLDENGNIAVTTFDTFGAPITLMDLVDMVFRGKALKSYKDKKRRARKSISLHFSSCTIQ